MFWFLSLGVFGAQRRAFFTPSTRDRHYWQSDPNICFGFSEGNYFCFLLMAHKISPETHSRGNILAGTIYGFCRFNGVERGVGGALKTKNLIMNTKYAFT